MKYLFLLVFAGAIFALCCGVDRLCRAIAARHPKPGKRVTLPRREAVFGVLLTAFSGGVLVGFFEALSLPLKLGCIFVLAMGAFLLVHYLSFGIWYNDTEFWVRDWRHRARRHTYGEITGQRSLLTRSGVTTTLYLQEGEVDLYEAMVGLREFLKVAFSAWCKGKDIDPQTVENNPELLTYFPTV